MLMLASTAGCLQKRSIFRCPLWRKMYLYGILLCDGIGTEGVRCRLDTVFVHVDIVVDIGDTTCPRLRFCGVLADGRRTFSAFRFRVDNRHREAAFVAHHGRFGGIHSFISVRCI